MQDSAIEKIVNKCLIKKDDAAIVLRAVFNSNYDLPAEIKARRPSFVNFKNTVEWGGTIENGFAAALATLNSKHGCFNAAFDLIDNFINARGLPDMDIYPGFGNPVFKDDSDLRCSRIRNILRLHVPTSEDYLSKLIDRVRTKTGKYLHPNLVFWNAAAIHALGLPKRYSSLMFILATQIRYLEELEDK